ncbi:probable 8-oxo-dgtp diphosphatase nudt15 [Stylonychia lemnae]|uniref:Probable 8-oxo-dgtp diphosphatase nudt15 n=1 Tax=Stylonychia lemnae TaxID=5949 RepID=A0A078A2S1_STYLE|nr:probable 8-oxo-dgtp diphosphatase nudt15 [Stylonychia lemnae]|eukprot:CDW76568.1 probable 8-oxo-dgtp diphosphatase nudt15 [Stylonychia lemnae]
MDQTDFTSNIDEQQPSVVHFDKSKRPKVGLGVIILNELNEILVSQRITPNSAGDGQFGLPGGHLEFGETFQECAQREIEEETSLKLDQEAIKYVATVNAFDKVKGYHDIDIYMGILVWKEQCQFKNMEPHNQTDWQWVKWEDFVNIDNLFYSFREFFAMGFKDLENIKQILQKE